MVLPKWYIECAEDYLSVLRSYQDYSKAELFEATKKQRLAEYKLMRERMNADEAMTLPPSSTGPLALFPLQQYDNSIMYKGHFQANRIKPSFNTSGFWENVLK